MLGTSLVQSQSAMDYFKRILRHYLVMIYTQTGNPLNADCEIEIGGAVDDLKSYIQIEARRAATQVMQEVLEKLALDK